MASVFAFLWGSREVEKKSEWIIIQDGNIPSTMMLHKYVNGADNIFSTMEAPLDNNTQKNGLGWSEERPTNKRLIISGGNMKQFLIYGQI